MSVSPFRLGYAAIVCAILFLFLFYGCTAQEEKEFQQALQEAAIHEAKCKVGLATNCSNDSTITIGESKPRGECRFDSDCSPVCEGSVFWKKGCDPQMDRCVKTFDTDCSAQKTTVGKYDFPKLCSTDGCREDTDAIHAKKEELIEQANKYTAAMQQTTQLRQVAAKNCISMLEDVTNNLIVSTALIYSVPTGVADLYSATTQQIIDQLNSAASKKMSPEEYIALNCKAVQALDSDYALLSKKRDLVMEDARPFEGR